MNHLPRRSTRALILITLSGLCGCGSEIAVHPDPSPEAELLVGSWAWQPEVSRLEIDADLAATQTSVFDNPASAPSSYSVSPNGDGTLALQGWMANFPCEPEAACDQGRAYQRARMTYHVDEEHFFPFGLVRLSGTPGAEGAAGAGVFEGYGVEETFGREGESNTPNLSDALTVVETRWRLVLEPDGSWSRTEETLTWADGDEPTSEEQSSAGTWTFDGAGNLSLREDDSGEIRRTLWKGDVLALDGLVFTRLGDAAPEQE